MKKETPLKTSSDTKVAFHNDDAFISYISKHLHTTSHSETLLMHQNSLAKEHKGQSVYKFGFGQSPFPIPPFIVESLKNHADQKSYLNVAGLESLCEKIATFHKDDVGFPLTKEHILVAPGSKILLFSLMAAFKQAHVILPSPTWVSYKPQALLCNHTVEPIRCFYEHKWRLTPNALEKTLKRIRCNNNNPIILILTYPGNPCGLSYTAQELEALSTVLRHYKVIVLADEIYGKLHYENNHQSISKYYPEGSIITTGLSKWCGAGGWRLGAALIPPSFGIPFMRTLTGIASELYSSASSPIQYAALKAYENSRHLESVLKHQRRILYTIGSKVYDILSDANLRLFKPEGGFYVFLDFENYKADLAKNHVFSSDDLCLKLLQDTGVALLAGTAFGMPKNSLTARLAFVDFDGEKALEIAQKNPGLKKDAFLNKLKVEKLLNGIHALRDWLKELS